MNVTVFSRFAVIIISLGFRSCQRAERYTKVEKANGLTSHVLYIREEIVTKLEECVTQCLITDICYSFFYDKNGGRCSLHAGRISLSQMVYSTSTTMVYYKGGKSITTTYLGCFIDSKIRAMTGFEKLYDKALTTGTCFGMCLANKFKYAALQNGEDCFCDNDTSYAKYGKVTDKECLKPCTGSAAQRCGGDWRNRVFRME